MTGFTIAWRQVGLGGIPCVPLLSRGQILELQRFLIQFAPRYLVNTSHMSSVQIMHD